MYDSIALDIPFFPSMGVLLWITVFVVWWLEIAFTEKPKVFAQSTKNAQRIIKSCPSLKSYQYTIWGNGHAQTLFNSVFRRHEGIPFTRERLTASDGGIVILDWIEYHSSENTPIVVIVPGICNSIESHYIKDFCKECHKNGLRAIVYTPRGVLELATPKLFTFGDTADLKMSIEYIHSKFPSAPMFGVGFSLGGNVLAKYAAEVSASGCDSILKGVITCSQGYDGVKGIEHLKQSRFYDTAISRKLTKLIVKHEQHFKGIIDVHQVFHKVSSVEDFDRHVTVPLHGYSTTEEYYRHSSCVHHLHNMKIPLMCVNALDDPLVHESLIPKHLPELNENIIIVTTQRGGHLCWCEGFIRPTGYWNHKLCVEFIKSLL